MKAKIIVMTVLWLCCLTATAKDSISLDLVKATLQDKVLSTKTLVVGREAQSSANEALMPRFEPYQGGTYPYRMDVNKSAYSSKDDTGKGLRFDQLKAGEVYYFTLLSKDGGKTFKTITFVSKQRPAE